MTRKYNAEEVAKILEQMKVCADKVTSIKNKLIQNFSVKTM